MVSMEQTETMRPREGKNLPEITQLLDSKAVASERNRQERGVFLEGKQATSLGGSVRKRRWQESRHPDRHMGTALL